MSTFLGQRSILRQMVVAPNTQTAWGTPIALAAMQAGEGLRFDTSGFAKISVMTESNYGQAGAGNSFAADNRITGYKTSLDISGMLTDFLAGWLPALAMGKETVTGTSPGPYTHTINFLDTTTVARGTTIYCKDTADIMFQLVDMGISSVTFTSTSTGSIKFKAQLIGTGVYVDGVLASMPAPVTRQMIYGSDAQFSIGPTSSAPNAPLYPRVNNWELTIDAGIAEQRVSGGGLYAGYLTVAMPKIKLKAEIAATNVSDVRAWQLGNVPLTIAIDIVSGASEMHFAFPNVVLRNNDLGDSSGNAAWTLNFDETNILQIGNTPLVTCTVKNSVASYLTAA